MTNALLWAAEIPWDDYRLGKTLCFFRAGKIGQLDKVMKMCTSGLNTPEGEIEEGYDDLPEITVTRFSIFGPAEALVVT